MTAADPVVRVPLVDLSEEYIGTELLVFHRDRPCAHRGGLSDLERAPLLAAALRVEHAALLFLGGDQVVVTDEDTVLTNPTPTALAAADD